MSKVLFHSVLDNNSYECLTCAEIFERISYIKIILSVLDDSLMIY